MSSVRRMVSKQQERDVQGTRMPEQPEQRTAKGRRQQLYLVLDDWNSGYTIRKVRLPPGSGEGSKRNLRKAITFVSAERGCPEYFTSAFGTKILVLHPCSSSCSMGIPITDVKDRTFMLGPLGNCFSCPIYFPVGDDRLFALDIGVFDYCVRQRGESWMWNCFPPPSSFQRADSGEPWVWHCLPYPPFTMLDVSSYAVQPDDGCILVSTKNHDTGAAATFVFDTEEYVWKPYSDRVFPFTGRGHYDPSLEAFVGLSKKDPETLGYLCSCTMASTGSGDTSDWKCSKETVYSKNPAERHVSATLVHMHPGEFCLVECVDISGVTADEQELGETVADKLRDPADLVPGVNYDLWQELWDRQEVFEPEKVEVDEGPGSVPHRDRFMYRVKTFSISYDTNGDLKLKHGQAHCYSLPHEASTYFLQRDPVAFWL